MLLALFLFIQVATAESPKPDVEKLLEPGWTSCEIDNDCTVIYYGCNRALAANRKYKEEATKTAYQYGGDPRAMNCLIIDPGSYKAICRENRCTIKMVSKRPG